MAAMLAVLSTPCSIWCLPTVANTAHPSPASTASRMPMGSAADD